MKILNFLRTQVEEVLVMTGDLIAWAVYAYDYLTSEYGGLFYEVSVYVILCCAAAALVVL